MFYTNPLGALRRSVGHRRRQPEHRLESGLGRAHRPLRRRLDHRDGDPVQVAALHLGRRPDLGHPASAASIRRKNEWTLPDAAAGGSMAGPAGILTASRRPARWSASTCRRPAGTSSSSRTRIAQADHRSAAHAAESNDRDRRRRRRREVRHHRQPDRRPHRQHRLRAGRGRRAAGQPDALQPVLSGEARLLPRGPRHLRLRARRRGGSGDRRQQRRSRRTCSTAAASASTAAASSRSTPAAG